MRARIFGSMVFAFAVGTAAVLVAQGPQTLNKAPDTTAVTGCIARAEAAPAGAGGTAASTTATNAIPASATAGTTTAFMLTKASAGAVPTSVASAAGASGASASKTVANQTKTVTAGQYRLEGSASMLAPYLDHRVEITGTVKPPAGGTGRGKAGDAPTLTVDSVQMLAATCS